MLTTYFNILKLQVTITSCPPPVPKNEVFNHENWEVCHIVHADDGYDRQNRCHPPFNQPIPRGQGPRAWLEGRMDGLYEVSLLQHSFEAQPSGAP